MIRRSVLPHKVSWAWLRHRWLGDLPPRTVPWADLEEMAAILECFR